MLSSADHEEISKVIGTLAPGGGRRQTDRVGPTASWGECTAMPTIVHEFVPGR